MKLEELYKNFVEQGFNNFYIEGIGMPITDDVHCLGYKNQSWMVYYMERGIKSVPIFITPNKDAAIKFYTDFISKIEHWHIVAFTRSKIKMEEIRDQLYKSGISIIQNDIPNYNKNGDIVYRLFVMNKDIFIAEKITDIPYFDMNLKK